MAIDITSYVLGKKAGGGPAPTPTYQDKEITITENGEQTITADSGYDGLSSVDITTNVSGVWKVPDGTQFRSSTWSYITGIDTSEMTDMTYMFQGCTNLKSIPQLNTSSVTNMANTFSSCSRLEEIPLIDTNKVTNFESTFYSCTNLTTVPILDTSSATNFSYMFMNCNKLTDNSLNNILKMCINATSYNRTKKLTALSISSTYYPASKIEALPNYQDFLNAGWTIGY